MPIDNPPKLFITDNDSMLPYETQAELLRQKDALNDKPSIMLLASHRLKREKSESFVRWPSRMAQVCGRLLIKLKAAGAFYIWLMGYANWDNRPDKTFLGLDQWLRAGFIVTARTEKNMAKELGVTSRTIINYLNTLEAEGFVKRVKKYKKGGRETINVVLLGFRIECPIKGKTEVTSIWLPEINRHEEIYGVCEHSFT